jgi:hypothetical protein
MTVGSLVYAWQVTRKHRDAVLDLLVSVLTSWQRECAHAGADPEHLDEILSLPERIRAIDDSDDPVMRRLEADALRLAGNCLRDLGRSADAIPARMSEIALRRRLLARDPDAPDAPAAHIETGLALVLRGDLERPHSASDALSFYEAAHAHFAAARTTGGVQALDEVGFSLDRLAWIALREGRLDDAEALLAQRTVNIEELDALAPTALGTVAAHCQLHGLLAAVAHARGNPDAVLAEARRAYAAAQRYLGLYGTRLPARLEFIDRGIHLAGELSQRRLETEATAILTACGRVVDEADARAQKQEQFQHLAAGLAIRSADLAWQRGDAAGAIDWVRRLQTAGDALVGTGSTHAPDVIQFFARGIVYLRLLGASAEADRLEQACMTQVRMLLRALPPLTAKEPGAGHPGGGASPTHQEEFEHLLAKLQACCSGAPWAMLLRARAALRPDERDAMSEVLRSGIAPMDGVRDDGQQFAQKLRGLLDGS